MVSRQADTDETHRGGWKGVAHSMSNVALAKMIEQWSGAHDSEPDSRLLTRFLTERDEDAFATLVHRHGPLVYGTCQRILGNRAEAEDAFQATFFVLARRAGTLNLDRRIDPWLHGVALRVAKKLRGQTVRRRLREMSVAKSERVDAVEPQHDFWAIIDEELSRMSLPQREVLLLCDLGGQSHSQTAESLGVAKGTITTRLVKARAELAARLRRRGITLTVGALSSMVATHATASVPATLIQETAKQATAFAVGSEVGSLTVQSLAEAVMRSIKVGVRKVWLFVGLVTMTLTGGGLMLAGGPSDPAEKKAAPAAAAAKPEAPKEKIVQQDDPLPAGSVLRFGTSRFRHGVPILTMAVSADGKTAYVASGNRSDTSTRAIDLETGRSLFNLGGDGEAIAIAPDGKSIVIKAGLHLTVCDSQSGKSLRTITIPNKSDRRSQADVLAFTPDGKAIATLTDGKDLHLIDFESGRTIREFAHDPAASNDGFSQVNAVAFSPDGKLLATGGYAKVNDDYFARLWDVETGQEIRRLMHGQAGYGIRCLTFSPDGKTLATLGTQAGVLLRLFEVDTGKLLRAFPKADRLRPEGKSVAFSPDGKTVAAALNSIHLYDVTTGEELLKIDRRASNLHFTDGGKTLTGAVSGTIYRWDTATGKTLTPEAGESVVHQILVTPDGSRVITYGQDGYGHIWDGTSGKHLRRIPLSYYRGVAMSPDGRFLAWSVGDSSVTFTVPNQPRSSYDGSRVRLYDIAADKVIDRFPAFKGDAKDLAFTIDGKKLVSIDQYAAVVRTWDFESGKEERSFSIQPEEELKKQLFFVHQTQLSPDGKTAVVTYQKDRGGRLGAWPDPQVVQFWDVASGKQHTGIGGKYLRTQTFSPNGRLVFDGHEVHDIASGRRVAALPDEPYIRAAAFSRDGRLLSVAVNTGHIQIWDVATWTKRNEFKGYEDRSITLTFGPGGRLFTGNTDTTTLVWDTRPPRVADSVTLETAWSDLATREASVSFKSEGRFLATPAETIKLFAEKIKPAEVLDAKQIQRLLVDLDSDTFAVREAASKALLGMDQQAIPYLEATLKSTESAEVRTRVVKLLEQHRRVAMTSEQLRQCRAVMVLELIGDGDSQNVLKKWAAGPRGALLTLEASAALKRLEGTSRR